MFESHLDTLRATERPQTFPQKSRLYIKWEGHLRQELAAWRDELVELEAQSLDKQLVYDNAKDRLLLLLEAEAEETGLLPRQRTREKPIHALIEEPSSSVSLDSGGLMTFDQLYKWRKQNTNERASIKPYRIQDPRGKEIPVSNWDDLLLVTAEWLIREGLLTKYACPVTLDGMTRYLVHVEPIHSTKDRFGWSTQLSNGLYLERRFHPKTLLQCCVLLLEKFGHHPAQFCVWLR